MRTTHPARPTATRATRTASRPVARTAGGRRPRSLVALVIALVAALMVAGCSLGGAGDGTRDSSGGGSGGSGGPTARPGATTTLRVLAGSELDDMNPLLDEAAQATGVDVQLTPMGSLEASDLVAGGSAGEKYDALWVSSDRYLALAGGEGQVATSAKIMSSPVVLGVREPAARRLGWSAATPPTWGEVATAVEAGSFGYAMTNPSTSNSGFSALVAVASALSGGGAALDEKSAAAVMPQLEKFFTGQKRTSGSTGWLTDSFVNDASVDGLVSYESTLLALQTSGRAGPLEIIAPSDGVISGDYPLALLAGVPAQTRDAYDKIAAWLRTPEAQQKIMDTTHRRPMVPGVPLSAELARTQVMELPFPATRAAVDTLLAGYFTTARRPASTIYVLDVSGSMAGERIEALRSAFTQLTTPKRKGDFTAFLPREKVTLLPFASDVQRPIEFTVPEADPAPVLERIRADVAGLAPGGRTALFEAMAEAYRLAAQTMAADPQAYVTVVVMTDGEANGAGPEHFTQAHSALSGEAARIPAFAIMFGDSSNEDLAKITETTGGRVFDGRNDLTGAFRIIRGYQ